MNSDTIVYMPFGSHLYGLNTPTSDKDYKRVYFPNLSIMLLNGPRSHSNSTTGKNDTKNTSEDTDIESFSLARFVDHAKNGEMIAIDMLFSPPENNIQTSQTWRELQILREQFLTKQMKAYVGYIKKQVHKYGIKGSRISSLKLALAAIEHGIEQTQSEPSATRIEEIWQYLHEDSFCEKRKVDGPNGTVVDAYVVMGSTYMSRSWTWELEKSLRGRLNEYGDRAQKAATNEGVDFKAVSHAYRACIQMKSLLETRTCSFPFTGKTREKLLAIKTGQIPFTEVSPELEVLYDEVVEKMTASDWPEKPDDDLLNTWLLTVYSRHYGFDIEIV